MKLPDETRQLLDSAIAQADRYGKNVLICVLDDEEEDLEIISSVDNATHALIGQMLESITEIYKDAYTNEERSIH